MFPVQLPITSPEEFSRCDERIPRRDPGKDLDLTHRSDAALTRSVERAIWNDEVLRAIEYYEIDVHARNGIIHLNGHIANTTSRIRIENAIRSVSGILGIRDRLVLDEKLTLEVAGALGALEHTHSCKFFTGSSRGIVSIAGRVSDQSVKSLAESCAARNPHVRAVINHVRVAGAVGPELPDLPFLQPTIGEPIYFLDGLAGVVTQVIINPNNRRVIAMTLRLNVTGPAFHAPRDANTLIPVPLVHVPMDTVRYLTRKSGYLLIRSNDRSRYQDFDPVSFLTPSDDWVPPYPYCPQDVLFPAASPTVDGQAAHRFPFEELLEAVSNKQQVLAIDELDS